MSLIVSITCIPLLKQKMMGGKDRTKRRGKKDLTDNILFLRRGKNRTDNILF